MQRKNDGLTSGTGISIRTGKINVRKFNDLNGNGIKDRRDPYLTGWVFIVRSNEPHDLHKIVGEVRAGESIEVKTGKYIVEEKLLPGWKPTTHSWQEVTVQPGKTSKLVFGNRPQPQRSCCQFGFRLYNSIPNRVRKLILIPQVPGAVIAVAGDEYDYILKKSGANYTIEPVDPLGFFPASSTELLDFDYTIQIDSHYSPTSLKTQWMDSDNNVIKEERQELKCEKRACDQESENNDWFNMRAMISGVPDDQLFAGFEGEGNCEEFSQSEMALECGFEMKPICFQGQQNKLRLESSSTAETFSWTITDNGVITTADVNPFEYNLSEDDHYINVELKISYLDPSDPTTYLTQNCSQTMDICIPTAGFTVGNPKANCDGHQLKGFNVDFILEDIFCTYTYGTNMDEMSIDWARLEFGDNTYLDYLGNVPSVETHNYSVPYQTENTATLTVRDVWGCTHKTQRIVKLLDHCEPQFDVVYELCPVQADKPGTVDVYFINKSQTFCNSRFTWNFGDPDSDDDHNKVDTINPDTVMHTYSFIGGGLPKQYTVTLSMTDNVCSTGQEINATFTLKPIELGVNVYVCPDTETYFVATMSDKVTWNLSGNNIGGKCKRAIRRANKHNEKSFTCDLDEGYYALSCEASATEPSSNPLVSVTRKCTKGIPFNVEKTCCFGFKVNDHMGISLSGKNYRLKYKIKVEEPTIGAGTRVKGKTKLKKERKIFGKSFYTGTNADTISLTIDAALRVAGPRPDNSNIICNCMTLVPVNGFETMSQSSKAKYEVWVSSSRGIRKDDTITSTHYVSKDGCDYTITVRKQPGAMCSDPPYIGIAHNP